MLKNNKNYIMVKNVWLKEPINLQLHKIKTVIKGFLILQLH